MGLCENEAGMRVPCTSRVANPAFAKPASVVGPASVVEQGFCTLHDAPAPSFFSEKTWQSLKDIFNSTLVRVNEAKTWGYQVACEETEMQDTCKKVGDAAKNGWAWVKGSSETIRGLGKSLWALGTADFFPFNMHVCQLSGACLAGRFFAQCLIIGGSVAGCLVIYHCLFRKPYRITVHPPRVEVRNYVDPSFPRFNMCQTAQANSLPSTSLEGNRIYVVRLTGE